jgi:hypothetical protein
VTFQRLEFSSSVMCLSGIKIFESHFLMIRGFQYDQKISKEERQVLVYILVVTLIGSSSSDHSQWFCYHDLLKTDVSVYNSTRIGTNKKKIDVKNRLR